MLLLLDAHVINFNLLYMFFFLICLYLLYSHLLQFVHYFIIPCS